MNNNTKTNSNTLKNLKTILSFGKDYKGWLIFAFIIAVVNTILICIIPHFISIIVNLIQDSIFDKIDIHKIGRYLIITLSLLIVILVLSILQSRIIASITQKISKQFRNKVIEKINTISVSCYNSDSSGEILSLISNDIDLIGQTLNQSVSTFVSGALMFVTSIVMMLLENVRLSAATLLATFIGVLLVVVILKINQKYIRSQQDLIAKVNGIIDETYSNADIVKLYNAEEGFFNKFDKENRSIRDVSGKSLLLTNLMMPLMALAVNIAYATLCIVGGIMVVNDTIKIGVIISFMLYIKNYTEPLSQLSQAVANFQQAGVSSVRVLNFLNKEDAEDVVNSENDDSGEMNDIVFENVTFGYTRDKVLFDNVTFKISNGQTAAFVGHTGSGKTTISSLLLRYYKIFSGKIRIYGRNVNCIKRRELNDMFSLVPQDIWLFEGSVYENIAYGCDEVDKEKVIAKCKELGINDVMMSLPNGYDTVIKSESAISNGQKQLITIARAMMKEAPILIMDEATSNIDTRLESIVQMALDKLKAARTTIIFAHRLSTLKDADIIYVLDNGKIVEQGKHNELLTKKGHYYQIYSSQFGDE